MELEAVEAEKFADNPIGLKWMELRVSEAAATG